MKKIKETVETVIKAAYYSFAFCLRHNKRDTIIVSILLLILNLIGYGMIVLTGVLISSIQKHLTTHESRIFTINDFMSGRYYIIIGSFVGALFLARFGVKGS